LVIPIKKETMKATSFNMCVATKRKKMRPEAKRSIRKKTEKNAKTQPEEPTGSTY